MHKIKVLVLVIFIMIFSAGVLHAYPSQEEVHLLSKLMPEEDQATLFYLCVDYDYDLSTVLRWIYVESSFDPNAVCLEKNGTKSVGYLQLNSSCWEYFDEVYYKVEHAYGEFDPFDPVHNLTTAFEYIYDLEKRFGDFETALLCHNAGPGRVSRGDIPLSSLQYSEFIMTGRVSPDSYLYNRMLKYNALIEEIRVDKMLVYGVE